MGVLSLPDSDYRIGYCWSDVPAHVREYLFRKLHREHPENQMEINFIQESIE